MDSTYNIAVYWNTYQTSGDALIILAGLLLIDLVHWLRETALITNHRLQSIEQPFRQSNLERCVQAPSHYCGNISSARDENWNPRLLCLLTLLGRLWLCAMDRILRRLCLQPCACLLSFLQWCPVIHGTVQRQSSHEQTECQAIGCNCI